MNNIDFAQITFQGRLTEDPEVRTLDNGRTMCKFRVASNRRFSKDKEEKTAFIPVTVFGNDANNCGEYLTKGRAVHVTGDFETDNWVDKDGNKRTGFCCVARNVIFGSGGRRDDESDDKVEDKEPPRSSRDRTRAYLRDSRGR